MTRFARARGSKSCNVKQPEEPTSWAQMKKAMESQHSKQDNYSSAKAALDSVKKNKDENDKPTVWGPLENDDPSNALGFLRSQLEKRRKNKDSPDTKKDKKNFAKTSFQSHKFKKESSASVSNHVGNHENSNHNNSAVDGIIENDDPTDALGFLKAQLGKRKKSKESSDTQESQKSKMNESTDGSLKNGKKKKSKGNAVSSPTKDAEMINDTFAKKEDAPAVLVDKSEKKFKKQKLENKEKENAPKKKSKKAKKMSENSESKSESSILLNKKKGAKRKLKNETITKEDEGEPEIKAKKFDQDNETSGNEHKSVNESFKNKGKRKHEDVVKASEDADADAAQPKKQKFNSKNERNRSRQFKTSKNRQKNPEKRFERREKLKNLTPEQRRKKPLPQTAEIFINGESVKLQMFDGFFVTKEDADRLAKLKADMLSKGLPLKDVNGAIKLERRRAEKALARLKKKVCFHCRKSGHTLSECPEIIDSHEKANNACYKCGSTEHTAYNCKVTHGNQFRFAECFICKEQGHIAKQCPDNPKGLYPKGGACNQCGDVTHLKKDCPQLIAKKEEMTLTAGLRNDRMIEVLDEDLVEKNVKDVNLDVKKTRKHVKF